jgi:AraC-like DNA-binding protein
MPRPPVVRRHVRVYSIGDLEIVERGPVVTDAEFAARGAAPVDVVTCEIIVRQASLGVRAPSPARPMTLRVPREWLEAATDPCVPSLTGSRDGLTETVAVGDVTLVHKSALARSAGVVQLYTAPVWLRETCQRIAANLRDARLSRLARSARVHPVHLSRTFRRFFGTTLTKLRRTLRLQRACEAIVRSERALARIAFDHGFSDQGHLTRTLRKSIGITPGQLRRKARRQDPP